jgi:serine/threonine-protein kinase
MDKERRIESVIRRFADGRPIDWSAAEATASSVEERAVLRGLRRVAEVAGMHARWMADCRPPDDPPPARSLGRWGDFDLLQKLGSGSFATVYRARDLKLCRDVALKLVRRRGRIRGPVLQYLSGLMLREGRNMARVEHPNVISVYGTDTHGQVPGLWMDLVEGRPLSWHLDQIGCYGPREAILVGIDLCRALAAIHSAGLIHGDVKAQNVMREEGGRIILMDLGICRETAACQDLPAGFWIGTPLYVAPELLAGQQATVQSDIYSLGVLLFHLVTSRFPFESDDMDGLRRAHEGGDPLLLLDLRADVPEDFAGVVEKAISVDPTARYRSAGELERELRQILAC